MRARMIFPIVGFCMISSFCSSQQSCNTFQEQKISLDAMRLKFKSEVNTFKQMEIFNAYTEKSGIASEQLKQCILDRQIDKTSFAGLQYYYTLGKTLYEAGKCDEAAEVFNSCLANPNVGKILIKGSTYAQVINQSFLSCFNKETAHDRSATMGWFITYRGKSGSYLASFFENLPDKSVLDGAPLFADEIESILERRIEPTDTINKSLIKKLSGDTSFVMSIPFIFIPIGHDFITDTLQQLKNLPDPLDSETTLSNEKMMEDISFINLHSKRLISMYFDSIKIDKIRMPVYMVGGANSPKGLQEFLEICKKMHFRVGQSVAYYMPLDQSIVVWMSSGGGTIVHEIGHALMDHDFSAAPFWLNEGIASLYEEADRYGNPIDNYRIIYIQEMFKRTQNFMKISALMKVDSRYQQDQSSATMINAYARYFCKFIVDEFGKETLIEIYKENRKHVKNDISSLDIILRFTDMTEIELQKRWQNYLLERTIPNRWRYLLEHISRNPVFLHGLEYSEIPADEKSIEQFNKNREKDLHLLRKEMRRNRH